MAVSIRDLEPLRPQMRELLTCGMGGCLRVEDAPTGRWIEVDLVPDGVTPGGRTAFLLRVAASDGCKLFDCGGMGVGSLTDEDLAFLIVAAFRALDRKPS